MHGCPLASWRRPSRGTGPARGPDGSRRPRPGCLALLEGNGRYAITFLHDRWSVRGGERYRQAEGAAATPMGNVREAAMSIKDRLSQDLDFGCYVIPVMMFTDMTPDPDILEEMRDSRVRLLWGLEDLVARLTDLPDGDQVQKQLGKRFISREVGTLSRRPRGRQTGPGAEGGDPDGERRSGDGPGRR